MAHDEGTGHLGNGTSRWPRHFHNFCPEVSFERFGFFASHLSAYADETDRDNAHRSLGKAGAGAKDWRWTWASVVPLHYSECPIYSPLAHAATITPAQQSEIFSMKPSLYGFGIDLRALLSGSGSGYKLAHN